MKPYLCILAGGRSSRFGSSKLWLRVRGTPIVAWLGRRLGDVCGRRWLSVAPGAELPPGAGGFDRILADQVGYGGPLPAMARVLAAAPVRAAVVFAAADMPLVEPAHLRRMLRLLHTKRCVGVMSRRVSGPDAGQVEPLPSVWLAGRGAAMMRRAMAAGVCGPQRLAGRRGVLCLALDGQSNGWANINRPEDAWRCADLRPYLPATGPD
jgi:molybdopterin-guanine dinucleotide biosynthesis protein A